MYKMNQSRIMFIKLVVLVEQIICITTFGTTINL